MALYGPCLHSEQWPGSKGETMKTYIVLYRDEDQKPLDKPLAFQCMAEDTDHAEEQCINAYPDCLIAWVYIGTDVMAAYDDYYECNHD